MLSEASWEVAQETVGEMGKLLKSVGQMRKRRWKVSTGSKSLQSVEGHNWMLPRKYRQTTVTLLLNCGLEV